MRWTLSLAVLGVLMLVVSFFPWTELNAAPSSFGAAPPGVTVSQPDAETVSYGKALFQAKGCVVCHSHRDVAGSGVMTLANIPTLSDYAVIPEYVQRWLSNPKAIKPATVMPNLNLKSDEIDALVAFLAATTTRK